MFDDDGSGEIADVVAMKMTGEVLVVHLYHCKYSGSSNPGARVNDLYAVCGQAQRSVAWRRDDASRLVRHLRCREDARVEKHPRASRFEKGDMARFDQIAQRGRPSGTLYNTIIYLGADGRLLGKHRKLMPTYTERLIWGQGDGSTLAVFDIPLGRVGGLVCWEHWMPLARHAMHVAGEQLHAALWPTVEDIHLVASRHYAFEGRCFVIAAGSVLRRDQVPEDLMIFHGDPVDPNAYLLAGGSVIIGPDGHCLAGPLGAEEAILYADLDLGRIPAEHLTFDAVGHYGRPDVFALTVNTAAQTHLDLEG